MLKVSFVNLCGVAIVPDFFGVFFFLVKLASIFIALHGMQWYFQVRNNNWRRKETAVLLMSFMFPV